VDCGKIVDSLAFQIQRIKGSEVVGTYDRETLKGDPFGLANNESKAWLATGGGEFSPGLIYETADC
jgi:TRAP-type mannitol/chloroaromatic compound transport system substrate-binding protein